jgi:hypothetical protein
MMRSIKLTISSSSLALAVATLGLTTCDHSDSGTPGGATPVADAAVNASPRDAAGTPDAAVVDAPAREVTPGFEVLPRPDVNPPDVGRVDGGPAVTMSFFITSTGSGAMGGNLGGLAGADMKCQTLAAAVGLGGKTWRAYLSTHADGATAAVNARDRIGTGPWYNYHGVNIAENVADLHAGGPIGALRLNQDHGLDETGNPVPARFPQTPPGNQHDILTGSTLDGTAFPASPDRTCANWTSSAERVPDAGAPAAPTGQVGHFDRAGGSPATGNSWNSAHASRACDQASFIAFGGAGRLYCVAIK